MKTHYVIYGGGAQSIVAIPVDEKNEPKVPSSATYAIVNLAYHEDSADRTVVAAGTPATVDSASATTDASAGRGTTDPRKVSVDDVTGFAEGSSYLITHSDGSSEVFEVDHIDASGNDLYALDEIKDLYPSGSSVSGIQVTATFPSAEAADETEFDSDVHYAIDWTFVGVSPTRRRDIIRVRRTAERVYAEEADITRLDQGLATYISDRLQGKSALVQAHRDVRRKLRERNLDPDTYHGGDTMRDAVTYRACELLRRQMGRGERDMALADYYADEFRTIMANLGGVDEVIVDRQTDEETFDLAERLNKFALT